MLQTKRGNKAGAKNLRNGKLTTRQLDSIRKILPGDWRKRIAQNNGVITIRQITEVFNQRNSKPDLNEIVWNAVNKRLRAAGRQDLVDLVEERLLFCTCL